MFSDLIHPTRIWMSGPSQAPLVVRVRVAVRGWVQKALIHLASIRISGPSQLGAGVLAAVRGWVQEAG